MTKFPGLHFQKFDLHVHTPASHDFPDKHVTPQQVIDRALEQGLAGIAITDHNTGEFIDGVCEAAKGHPIVVFPGAEICCTAGKSGVHVIALLDSSKRTKHIHALLAALKISVDRFGDKNAVTTLAPIEVIDIITHPPFDGLVVLAHCTSSKGVLHDMSGQVRQRIFENTGLLAVETSTYDFQDPAKQNSGKRAIDVLNGRDDNYCNRRLAVYIASDSMESEASEHSLRGIGSKWTYFKVDAEPSLESLRQCFIDRDVRIRQHFEITQFQHPRISEISVKGGFFDGEKAQFHDGLNSLLGAKGAGKSLLVELLRFALNSAPMHQDIRTDHEIKLQKRLETYGTVTVTLVDETGVSHTIERIYNPSLDSPYAEEHHESIAASFGTLFMSQNEIVKIAEDEKLQMAFIDQFFDFRHFRDSIENIEQDLVVLDAEFAEGLRATQLLADTKRQLATIGANLQRVDKLLSDQIYDDYKMQETKDIALRSQSAFLDSIKQRLHEYLSALEAMAIPALADQVAHDPAVRRNSDVLTNVLSEVKTHVRKAIDCTEKGIATGVKAEYAKWAAQFSTAKEKYQKHIRESGGDKKELEKQRVRLVSSQS